MRALHDTTRFQRLRCAVGCVGLALLTATASSACISIPPKGGSGCATQRDCEAGLVCVDSTCRAPCVVGSDCDVNETCVDGLCAPGSEPEPVAGPGRPTSGLVPAAGRLRGGQFTLDAHLGEALAPTHASGGSFRLEASATLNPGRSR